MTVSTEQLIVDVERHERILYGGNGEGLGLNARVVNVEKYIEGQIVNAKEAREDRRKIMTAVVAGVIINAALVVLGLIVTHPAFHAAAAVLATPHP